MGFIDCGNSRMNWTLQKVGRILLWDRRRSVNCLPLVSTLKKEIEGSTAHEVVWFSSSIHRVRKFNYSIGRDQVMSFSPSNWHKLSSNSLKPFALIRIGKLQCDNSIPFCHSSVVQIVQSKAAIPTKDKASRRGKDKRHVHAKSVSVVVLASPLMGCQAFQLCLNILSLFFRHPN